ncbi:MAG: hypothetical protein HY898_28385 [Deltaproteobacteria bacterium]|nr:hypothetical protein [Deltaproteobacteria bacterium]
MKARPVERYETPAYPTRVELMASPGWLRDNLPPSWRANLEMAGAVALFVTLGTLGCEQRPPAAPANPPVQATQPAVIQVASVPPTASGTPGPAPESRLPAAAVVAPIFQHGDGRGATGCVVVAPPVFLSEEEALQIIREELARVRLSLPQSKVPVPGVELPAIDDEINTPRRSAPPSPQQLKVDAADTVRGVAVEFVSGQDALAMQGHSMSSVQGFDTRGAAESLAKSVRETGRSKMYFGVLYDPISHVDFRDPSTQGRPWEEMSKEAKDASRKLLREQVQDFVQWLRTQGAL